MSSPWKTIRPAVGRSTPVRQLKNVDLPAPLGPMMPRSWWAGTARDTWLRAVSPPKRTISPSVCRSAGTAAPPLPAAAVPRCPSRVTLGELARRREVRLLLGDHFQDPVLVVLDREDELPEERLVVLLAEGLVALREVVPLLDLHALERLDQLHRVLAAAEGGPLDAELQKVRRLEVRLDVPVRQRARRVDLLQGRHRLVEELPVRGRVERRVQHGDVTIDADE